jgi:hypothetical protein
MSYYDFENNEIKVGSRVVSDPTQNAGTVTSIDDPDCDYDDELQRAVQYGPYVHVLWDADAETPEEELTERFSGYNVNISYYEEEKFVFDDIEVVDADWQPIDPEYHDSLEDDTIEEGFMYGEDLT